MPATALENSGPTRTRRPHFKTWDGENFAKDYRIEDNVFYKSRLNLFQVGAGSSSISRLCTTTPMFRRRGAPSGIWNRQPVEGDAAVLREKGIDQDPVILWEESANEQTQ